MLSAKKAREISGSKKPEHLSFIEDKIKKAVSEHNQSITIYDYPYCEWSFALRYNTPIELEAKIVIDELKSNGYTISHRPLPYHDYIMMSVCSGQESRKDYSNGFKISW